MVGSVGDPDGTKRFRYSIALFAQEMEYTGVLPHPLHFRRILVLLRQDTLNFALSAKYKVIYCKTAIDPDSGQLSSGRIAQKYDRKRGESAGFVSAFLAICVLFEAKSYNIIVFCY